MDEKTLTILIGAVVGLLPLLANTIISALQGRSARSRRDDAISVAKQRIDFLEAWIKTQESVSMPERYALLKQAASQELDDIRQGVLTALQETAPRMPQFADRRVMERIFLLYRPIKAAGWVLHTLFYIAGGMILAIIALTLLALPQNDVASLIFFDLLFGVPLIILALIFRALAVRADRRIQDELKAKAAPASGA